MKHHKPHIPDYSPIAKWLAEHAEDAALQAHIVAFQKEVREGTGEDAQRGVLREYLENKSLPYLEINQALTYLEGLADGSIKLPKPPAQSVRRGSFKKNLNLETRSAFWYGPLSTQAEPRKIKSLKTMACPILPETYRDIDEVKNALDLFDRSYGPAIGAQRIILSKNLTEALQQAGVPEAIVTDFMERYVAYTRTSLGIHDSPTLLLL